jgi:hypothetical protein
MTLKEQDGKYFEKGGAGGMVEASEDGRLVQIGASEEGGDEEDVAVGVEVVGDGGVAGDGGAGDGGACDGESSKAGDISRGRDWSSTR